MNDFNSICCPLDGVNLIEAGAGTGKTYNLQNLVARLVLEAEIPLPEILVVTYTEAATAELKSRIRTIFELLTAHFENRPVPASERERIAQLATRAGDADQAARRLRAAMRDFDRAAIFTIHGFCRKMLLDNAFESGVRYGLTLLTDPGAVKREIAGDFRRRELYAAGEFRLGLWTCCGLSKLDALLDPVVEAAGSRVVFDPSDDASPEDLEAELAARLAELGRNMPEGLRELAPYLNKPFGKNYIDSTLAQLRLAVTGPNGDITIIRKTVRSMVLDAHSVAGKKTFPPERLAAALDAMPFFDLADQFLEKLRAYRAAVLQRALEYRRVEYARRKRRDNFLTFDDLLTRLDDRLQSPGGQELANAIRGQFRAALVDEFQDTDPVQFRIFQTVFANSPTHTLFMVGDPKQAIYRFRGGDLYAYLRARAIAAPERRYTLRTNYRSRAAYLTKLNELFAGHRRPFVVPEITFPAIEWPASAATGGGDPDEPLRLLDAEQRGAAPAAADEVVRLLDSGRYQPDDIAVLAMRKTAARDVFAELEARGIPAIWTGDSNVFDSAEAAALLGMLDCVLAPADTQGATAVLAGPFFALDGRSFLTCAEDGRLLEFQETLKLLRRRWLEQGFMPMFSEMLETFRLHETLIGRAAGERSLTNLLHLGEILHRYATSGQLAPEPLTEFLRNQLNPETREAGTEGEFELRLATERSAVRILTVHRSKGLEFRAVILPDLFGSGYDGIANHPDHAFHDNAGNPVIDLTESQVTRPFQQYEKLQELVRCAYVALTRARECCTVLADGAGKTGNAPAWLWLHRTVPENCGIAEIIDIAAGTGVPPEFAPAPESPPEPWTPSEISLDWTGERTFSRALEWNWGIKSFSSLFTHTGGVPEFDEPGGNRADDEPPAGIFQFPAGKRVGDAWHGIFEHLSSFAAEPDEIRAVAETELAPRGLLPDPLREIRLGQTCEMIRAVLTTPIPALGVALAEIPPNRMIRELGFTFALGRGFQTSDLLGLLRRHGFPVPEQTQAVAGGFMTGFLDLMFEFNGKFYVLDWKSNSLGNRIENFSPDRLGSAMSENGYSLQAMIYLTALARFLRFRRRGAFAADRDLGGACYCFLRGVSADAPGRGFWFAPPPTALLNEMEEMFG